MCVSKQCVVSGEYKKRERSAHFFYLYHYFGYPHSKQR